MRFCIVDCFAEEKYQGNELMVVVADRFISDEEQQQIAREINFSETAFILSGKQDNGGYDVRIWTPNAGELPFAGHPTLGAAYVILQFIENGHVPIVSLNLKVGQIPVIVSECGMTMRQNPPQFGRFISKDEIVDVFGIELSSIRDDCPVQWVSTGLEALIIPLTSSEVLSKVKPDRDKFLEYIARHHECNCNHLFFAAAGKNVFSARCFMEDLREDPATGSANGNLAAYLLKYNCLGSNDIRYRVNQGEDMGRCSVIHVHASVKNDEWQIEVGGGCHVVATGEWN